MTYIKPSKALVSIAAASFLALSLSGCSGDAAEQDGSGPSRPAESGYLLSDDTGPQRFAYERTNLLNTYVLTDNETGCQYLVESSSYFAWAVPLLDVDGMPLLAREKGE